MADSERDVPDVAAAYTLGWRDHEAGVSPRPPLAAQPSAEPGLDVREALRRDQANTDLDLHDLLRHTFAALSPDRPTPDPDRLTEARDEAAYWRRQAIGAEGPA